jgi:3-methylfumaryl-CoA hydratase
MDLQLLREWVGLTENQSIVFRDERCADAEPSPSRKAPADAEFSREVQPDAVLLFRYSALTFNAHRIHYDRAYATQIECYPGLVVHGPLIATLRMDLLREQRPHARVRRFAFKAVGPLYDTSPFKLCGMREPNGGLALWACNPAGDLAMSASAELA